MPCTHADIHWSQNRHTVEHSLIAPVSSTKGDVLKPSTGTSGDLEIHKKEKSTTAEVPEERRSIHVQVHESPKTDNGAMAVQTADPEDHGLLDSSLTQQGPSQRTTRNIHLAKDCLEKLLDSGLLEGAWKLAGQSDEVTAAAKALLKAAIDSPV